MHHRVWILVALLACTSACSDKKGGRGAHGPWKRHEFRHHHGPKQQPAKPPPAAAEPRPDASVPDPADAGEIFEP